MSKLVASVKEHGILEPVLVRPLGDGNYELIAGERRLRAAREIGLTEIPANAKNRNQELKGNVSLQLEKIEAYLVELGRFNLESFRSSRSPLLNLPPNILEALREGNLEYTKARTIARVKDEQQRDTLLEQTITQSLSLNEIKAKVKEAKVDPTLEIMPEQVLISRMGDLTKRLKRSKACSDRKKRERITKLLDELERLTAED